MKTTLFATLALCAVLPAQGFDIETTDPVVTTLTQIRTSPDAYRNVPVQFVVQFASLGKISNPFFTQFTPTEFANLNAWADDQPLWQRASYEDIFGNLFYAKTGAQLQQLYDLRIYQRLQVTGVVRNTFQSTPWIEVTSFSKLSAQVDTAVLSHMYRGEQLMQERRWQRAIAEFSLAPGAGTPPEVQRAAYKNLGVCYLRIGESAQAQNCLEMAANVSSQRDTELNDLLATARTRPSNELDRTVGAKDLKDHERPMWEAFEQDAQPTTAGTNQNATPVQ